MAVRDVLAGLVVLVAAGGGCGEKRDNGVLHSCSGAAVNVTVVPTIAIDSGVDAVPRAIDRADAGCPPVASDGGADAGDPTDVDAGCWTPTPSDARPACTGRCLEYIQALRVAIEAVTPARCVLLTFGTGLSCVPSATSPGCPTNTFEEARALEAQIRDYLAAYWPEIDTPTSIESCVCRIYFEA